MADILISFRALRNNPDYDEKTLEVSNLLQALDLNQAGYKCEFIDRFPSNYIKIRFHNFIYLNPSLKYLLTSFMYVLV